MTSLPPRLGEDGVPYYGSDTSVGVVVNTPRANVSVGGDGVRVRVGPRRRHDDDNNHDDDEEEDEGDDDDEHAPLRSPEEQQAYDQRVYEKFRNDRPGSSLGCMVAQDGEYCAAKQVGSVDGSGCAVSVCFYFNPTLSHTVLDQSTQHTYKGCEFFNSCCYASWVRLAGAGGYMLSPRSIRNVEYMCPGSVRFLGVDGCT